MIFSSILPATIPAFPKQSSYLFKKSPLTPPPPFIQNNGIKGKQQQQQQQPRNKNPSRGGSVEQLKEFAKKKVERYNNQLVSWTCVPPSPILTAILLNFRSSSRITFTASISGVLYHDTRRQNGHGRPDSCGVCLLRQRAKAGGSKSSE